MKGGVVSNRGTGGFTLIELMIVVVIIGILASISMLAAGNIRERAYYATMKSDLSRLASVEEAYWDSQQNRRRGPRYGRLRQLQRTLNFQPSQNVILSIRANPRGWSARARHRLMGRRDRCAIFFGSGSRPYPPSTKAGVMACQ